MYCIQRLYSIILYCGCEHVFTIVFSVFSYCILLVCLQDTLQKPSWCHRPLPFFPLILNSSSHWTSLHHWTSLDIHWTSLHHWTSLDIHWTSLHHWTSLDIHQCSCIFIPFLADCHDWDKIISKGLPGIAKRTGIILPENRVFMSNKDFSWFVKYVYCQKTENSCLIRTCCDSFKMSITWKLSIHV